MIFNKSPFYAEKALFWQKLRYEQWKIGLAQQCAIDKESAIFIQSTWYFTKITYPGVRHFAKISAWLEENCRFFTTVRPRGTRPRGTQTSLGHDFKKGSKILAGHNFGTWTSRDTILKSAQKFLWFCSIFLKIFWTLA